MNRTPKTLQEAINNGLMAACQLSSETKATLNELSGKELQEAAGRLKASQIETVERHVLDFFRQKFGVAYLEIDHWFEDRTYKDPAGIIRELAESTGVAKKAA
jgi:hypothetical protein